MSGTDSNSAFPPLPPKSKNVAGNRTDIGWKRGTDASGNRKKDDDEDLGDDFLRGLDEWDF